MWNRGTRDTLDASAGDVLLEIPFVLDRANKHYFLPYEAFVRTGVFFNTPFTIKPAYLHYNET